ncbi:MAG: AraC family transcriptional regulator [Bacteroidaceae bacterium]|nr:AraC family transcriptional regulator [Bacteroidaceae bacterium]
MIHTENIYWYGIAAAIYLTSCWMFAVIRWFHTCQEPKERHDFLWPDRKLLVVIYLCSAVLLPYVMNPASLPAWTMWKSYFACTYYFYGGALFFCFFGTVKHWQRWRATIRTTSVITFAAMAPLVADAWTGGLVLSDEMRHLWQGMVTAVSILMMVYCALSMRQTLLWMIESRDENYSNPDDFPMEFARRVWLLPVVMTLLVWPPYILDSPALMAVMNLLLSVFNVVMLLFVLPVWRRAAIVPEVKEYPEEADLAQTAETTETEREKSDLLAQKREQRLMKEIEHYVRYQKAYLDAHLKLEQVVEHCSYSRTYVSQLFTIRFGGFSRYVNRLRLQHYAEYMAAHPDATKEAAAQESGFTSYSAYYKVKGRIEPIATPPAAPPPAAPPPAAPPPTPPEGGE